MIYAPPPHTDSPHQSLYAGITGWASHAHHKVLVGLTLTGAVIGTAVVATDWRRAPLAGLLLVAAAVGGWGLLEQRTVVPHSTLVRVTQVLLVLLGTLGAIVAGLGLLFWVMGPAPVL